MLLLFSFLGIAVCCGVIPKFIFSEIDNLLELFSFFGVTPKFIFSEIDKALELFGFLDIEPKFWFILC